MDVFNFESISQADIPENALKKLMSGEKKIPEQFVKITHPDSTISYALTWTDKMTWSDKITPGASYKTVKFVDVIKDMEIGWGEINFTETDEKNALQSMASVVLATMTNLDMMQRGLGERRIIMMGAFSKARFRVPLCASTAQTPESKKIWQNLSAKSLTQEILDQNGNKRTCLI